MNYWQWEILSRALSDESVSYNESATLAYIPTITAWSRQSIFRGDKPVLTESNSNEAQLFTKYWENNGLSAFQVKFIKMDLNQPSISDQISEEIKVLGLVCNDLDEIMHGSILGDEQLKISTEQWIKTSKIVSQIIELKTRGFKLFITADHGNVEAVGLGNLRINDKVGILSRSKRFLNFSNETILNNFLEQHQDLNIGRRDLSLYLKEKGAFTNEDQKIITHGGSHFWEVLIPFITINEN
jgi:hypothetical protein